MLLWGEGGGEHSVSPREPTGSQAWCRAVRTSLQSHGCVRPHYRDSFGGHLTQPLFSACPSVSVHLLLRAVLWGVPHCTLEEIDIQQHVAFCSRSPSKVAETGPFSFQMFVSIAFQENSGKNSILDTHGFSKVASTMMNIFFSLCVHLLLIFCWSKLMLQTWWPFIPTSRTHSPWGDLIIIL